MKDLFYKDLEMQPYFKYNGINPRTARDIFKYQTRLSNVKTNFKAFFNDDLNCPVPGCSGIDNQSHLLDHCDEQIENREIFYSKLFSLNPEENLEVIKLLVKSMAQRVKYVEDEHEQSRQ